MYNVFTASVTLPPPDKREIYRYAGGRGEIDEQTLVLLDECLLECVGEISPRVCYAVLPTEQVLQELAKDSALASRRLDGCKKALVFAATIGLGIDRLMKKYASLAPAKALLLQAIGAERIEALCEAFCAQKQAEENVFGKRLTPRFSPGYGDFSLQAQKRIHALLDCPRKIGVTLNDSLLMSPTKSVTAIVGIGENVCMQTDGCASCNKRDCTLRKEGNI